MRGCWARRASTGIIWTRRAPLASWAADQPCPTTGIPRECGGGQNIRSRGETHRPVRMSWHRGAGASMAAGEADRRADAVEVDRAVFRHACPAFFLVGWSRTSAGVISLLRASYERSSDDIGSTSGTGGASISGIASFRGKSNVKPLRYSREQSSSVSSNSRRDIRHTTQRSFVSFQR